MNRSRVVVTLVTLLGLQPMPAFAQLKVTEASSVSVQWPKHVNTKTAPLRILAADGRLAASTEELPSAIGITHVRLFDGRTGKELDALRAHVDGVSCMAFSPDGSQFATGGLTDGTVKVWDLKTLKQSAVFREFKRPSALAFSPDGKTLATVGRSLDQRLIDRDIGVVRLWDIGSGKERANLLCAASTGANPLGGLRFSPNGKRLLAGMYEDGSAEYLWDLDRERLVLENKYGTRGWLSYDSKHLVTRSASHQLLLLDAETGKEKWAVDLKKNGWNPFTFSPDGTFVAVNTSDGIDVVETETGKTVATLKGITIPYGRVSPDGKTLTALVENKDKETVIKTWELTWEKRPGK